MIPTIAKPSEGQTLAMEAIFQLTDAVHEHQLSVADLAQVIHFAVGEGHDWIAVALAMASNAVVLAQDTTAQPPECEPTVPT